MKPSKSPLVRLATALVLLSAGCASTPGGHDALPGASSVSSATPSTETTMTHAEFKKGLESGRYRKLELTAVGAAQQVSGADLPDRSPPAAGTVRARTCLPNGEVTTYVQEPASGRLLEVRALERVTMPEGHANDMIIAAPVCNVQVYKLPDGTSLGGTLKVVD